uniref:Trichoplein keratin filament-binding protein n=1 Tax=Strigamia maritima TaxID=126957 RepID=T1ITZ2_STRMM
MEKENKERLLNERKTKLALMLKEEKEQFEIEFKKMSERRYARSENKENSRDQENKPLRDCYREWIRNKQTNKMLTNNNEISDKKDKVDNSKFEKLKLLDEENDEYKLKQTEEVIKRHMEELKMKEKETNRLRLELELLQKKQWKLEELEEEQQERIKEHNKTKETARILKHQLKVHLQNRARDILTQLEEDREMMRHAAHEMEFERKQNDVWREKNRNDTEKFRKIIDEQIEAEKKRQSELGSLFNEEAGKVWKQLEEQWNRERYFRREVMSELMDGLRKETEEKIVENVKQQEESVKTREDLLRMIEEGKEKMLKNQKKLSEQMQLPVVMSPASSSHAASRLSLFKLADDKIPVPDTNFSI